MKRIKIGSGRALIAATIIGASFAAYATTTVLKDINPGSPASNPGDVNKGFALLGSRLVFSASTTGAPAVTPDHGVEPWVTDGTLLGTLELADINTGVGSSNPTNFTPFGGNLYFVANSASVPPALDVNRELYRTNGTAVGTTLVKDLIPGPVSGIGPDSVFPMTNNAQLAAAGGELWLRADAADAVFFGADLGVEALRFNGTRLQALDLNPAAADSFPSHFRGVGSLTAFVAADAVGRRIHLFNASLVPATDVDLAALPTVGNDTFSIAKLPAGVELALDDGCIPATQPGCQAVAPPGGATPAHPTTGVVPHNACTLTDPQDAMVHGGKLYFSAMITACSTNAAVPATLTTPIVPGNATAAFGRELLVYTPSDPNYAYVAGTVPTIPTYAGYARLVKDINLGAGDGIVPFLTAFPFAAAPAAPQQNMFPPLITQVGISTGARLFFIANDGGGQDLWSTTAGTSVTTTKAKDNIFPVAPFTAPLAGFAVLPGNRIVFAADDGTGFGLEPWVSDGTIAGTTMITDVNPGAGSSITADGVTTTFDRAGNNVYFAAVTAAGREAWVTNGLSGPTNTSPLDEFNFGGSSDPRWFSNVAGRLVFSASDGALNGQELVLESSFVPGGGTSGGGGAGSGSGGGSSGGSGSGGGGGGGGAIDLTILAGLAALALSRRRWKLH